jgi:holliday junction DNA helicase RuvB
MDIDPLAVGAAWAIHGHVTDRQTRQLKESFAQLVSVEEEPKPVLINAAEYQLEGPQTWEGFIGQDSLKQQLEIHIASAKARDSALDHVLLSSGMPGTGKTTLAHLIAKEMGSYMIKLVPPFSKDTLFEAAENLSEGDVLFIDEIHKMADGGPRMAENLLHMLEEARLYTDDGVIQLEKFTVIGASTDSSKLPEPVIDRFVIKPHFEPYTTWDLALISAQFAGRYIANVDNEVLLAIAVACRGTPRIARELVLAGRDLAIHYDRSPTAEELFAFKQMDPDGITLAHKNYLLALYRHFGRRAARGGVEYLAGESSLMKILRENKRGLANIERFLLELGLLDQTPQGRRLTVEGIARAQFYDAQDRR